MTNISDKLAATGNGGNPVSDCVFEAAASFAQQRLWFLEQLNPGSAVYNISFALHLHGNVSCTTLQQALNDLANRHEVLRTAFATAAQQLVQLVGESGHIPLESAEAATGPRLHEQLVRLANRPFDLSRAPLMRATLLTAGTTDSVLLLAVHHIIADAWSIDVLYRELSEFYAARTEGREPTLAELPVQYADFAEWQQEWLAGDELSRQITYWKQQLAGAPAILELPLDRPRGRTLSHRGSTVAIDLDAALANQVKKLGQRCACSQFNLYLAVFAALLARYSNDDSLVIGTPIAGRQRPELEPLIGFFVNTLALRLDLQGDPDFRGLLERTRQTTLGAFAHQDLPFEKLVEELQPERALSHAPIFQVMFVMQNTPQAELDFGPVLARSVGVEMGIAKFDLLLEAAETDFGLRAGLQYNTDLFSGATIARMLEQFETLLRAVVADPTRPVSRLPLLDARERQRLLTDFNATQQALPVMRLQQLVEAQVARTPDTPAVVFGSDQLSYAELNRRANRLAHELQQTGAGPGALVAICAERSIDTVVAVLAVLKSGAAYVPVDPDYPAERIAVMLSDSGACAVLTQTTLAAALPAHGAHTLCLDSFDWNSGNADNPDGAGASVYVIYTSGSTGKPKGVELTHAGLGNLVQWQNSQPGLDTPARTLQFASLSFDVSFQEIFTTWTQGGTLVLVSNEQRRDLAGLARFITTDGIERVYLPFAALQPLADAISDDPDRDYRVQDVIVAGEQLQVTPAVRRLFNILGKARLHNHYGPSETHVVTAFTLTGDADTWPALPPIGTPVANTRVYVLDRHGEPVPVGMPGELHLGGVQVAKGYLGRPELTAAKFLADPFSTTPDARMYRTGDRVRFLADGNLEYLGRTDDQLKWRGFRIEPGEIETALATHPSVRQAVVLLREDTPGDKRLVAYVVGETPDTGTLRAHLKQQLPEYMVPSVIVILEALPLTPSGKVARRALPAPDYSDSAATYVAPRNPVEETLAQLWAAVLGVPKVGIHDDFFQLGGHSLLATRLISRIRDAFNVDLPLKMLFENPVVADCAHALTQQSHNASPPLQKRKGRDDPPLSFSQQRLWFLDQLEPGNPAYNFPVALELKGSLDPTALQTALDTLVTRHESLRTTFPTVDSSPVQHILPQLHIPVQLADAAASAESFERQLTHLTQLAFDLQAGPLLRATLLRHEDQLHTLLLVTHHIVSDGWSLHIMLTELAAGYRAHCAGESPALPKLALQFADFAVWQRNWLQGIELERQLDYWRTELADMPGLLELPADEPRPAEQSYHGSGLMHWLDKPLHAQLCELAAQQGCTLYMLLLAAFDVLLARYAAADAVVVGTPIAGRNRTELEGQIGFFSNTVAIPVSLQDDPDFIALMRKVRKATLGAFAHQDLPFEKLVEELRPERALSHAPIFQVMFVMQNTPQAELDFGPVLARSVGVEMGIAKFDLLLEAAETDFGLRAGLQYNTDLFSGATIARMLEQFETLLRAVVADPTRPVSRLPLLDARERQRLLTDFNATQQALPVMRLQQLVEAQVARTPDTPAVVFGSDQLSYAELNRRANRLAHELQQTGAGPGALVAICAERSIDTVVAVLAVLKSGAAYVPVDPDYPAERIAVMLSDSGACAVLTQTTLAAALPAHGAHTLCLDSFDWNSGNADNPDGAGASVYVIYTSGSTGKPKGVELTHAGLGNLVQWQNSQPGLDTPARTLQFASLSFDVSFQEIFTTWTQGGTLVLVSNEQRRDLAGLARFITTDGIERVYLPFAALQPLADAISDDPDRDYRVQDVIVAGEQLQVTPAVRRLFNILGKARLHNHYGPSETHVVTAFTLTGDADTWPALPPIGTPVANTRVYVLDRHGEPVPVGMPGELHLGGVQVAKGYLGRPELTAAKFLADPFSTTPDARMYRTGDRVRFLADGNLEYLGRTDDQLKWRGFRIEPGEIETALATHPSVRQAVVLLREDTPGDKRLVAYVVGETPDTGTLRAHLKQQLPEYMVPSVIVILEALPLTPSGKVARRALPAPDYSDSAATYVAPRNPVEETLAQLWAAVLGVPKVGIHDDFFQLGGHSLLATRLISRIRDAFNVDLPLKMLFRSPTVGQAADVITTITMTQDLNKDDESDEAEEFRF